MERIESPLQENDISAADGRITRTNNNNSRRPGPAPSPQRREHQQNRIDPEGDNEAIEQKLRQLKQELKRKSSELYIAGSSVAAMKQVIEEIKGILEGLSRSAETREMASQALGLIEARLRYQGNLQFPGRYVPESDRLFMVHLSGVCPELTPMEMRICALLRTNLTTKEIAEVLSSSPQTVDTHRKRIRRKLKLPIGANLYSFLASIDVGHALASRIIEFGYEWHTTAPAAFQYHTR
jgi:DNA-binding CsgD family transcriptional regulator